MKKGLVLEGGGVKGSYQIGSFYAFKDCHVKLDGFVGTSIGSFNACMLASNMHKELLDFWNNVNPGDLLDFNKNFVKGINNKEVDIKSFMGALSTLKQVVKNKGIDNNNMRGEIYDLVDYDKLIKSNKDFGLVTVRLSGLKPLYVYKDSIKSKDKLIEYLMASCYFPGFKEKKLIDNHYYIDGGFYDNSPIKLLKDKGYDKVYVINIKGIGRNRKIPKDILVEEIKPSRDNGLIFELDQNRIRDNIQMGYYDTLRVLKQLDGYRYCFKRRSESYYEFITRKVDKRLIKRAMVFFNTASIKECVIKSLEYVCEQKKVDYYKVYNSYHLIKEFRKIKNKKFMYQLLREIKFL